MDRHAATTPSAASSWTATNTTPRGHHHAQRAASNAREVGSWNQRQPTLAVPVVHAQAGMLSGGPMLGRTIATLRLRLPVALLGSVQARAGTQSRRVHGTHQFPGAKIPETTGKGPMSGTGSHATMPFPRAAAPPAHLHHPRILGPLRGPGPKFGCSTLLVWFSQQHRRTVKKCRSTYIHACLKASGQCCQDVHALHGMYSYLQA